MDSELLHWYALISASNARIAAMQAANTERTQSGSALAYSEDWFEAEANEQAAIAKAIGERAASGC